MGKIPVFLISGPLGAGKTTLINGLLGNLPGKTGVVVNDFGPIGLDGKLLKASGAPGVVLEIPGGCLCCTVQDQIPQAVSWMLDQNPGRLLIEPSGVARPSQLRDLLVTGGLALREDIHTLVLLPVSAFQAQGALVNPLLRDQAEAAAVVSLTHADHASQGQGRAAMDFLEGLYPQRRLAPFEELTSGHWFLEPVSTAQSWPLIGGELLDTSLSSNQEAMSDASLKEDHSDHHLFADGLTWSPETQFDLMGLIGVFTELAQQKIIRAQCPRAKGVFQTEAGSVLIELAQGKVFDRPAAWSGPSQCDVLLQDPTPEDWSQVWLRFEHCSQTP